MTLLLPQLPGAWWNVVCVPHTGNEWCSEQPAELCACLCVLVAHTGLVGCRHRGHMSAHTPLWLAGWLGGVKSHSSQPCVFVCCVCSAWIFGGGLGRHGQRVEAGQGGFQRGACVLVLMLVVRRAGAAGKCVGRMGLQAAAFELSTEAAVKNE